MVEADIIKLPPPNAKQRQPPMPDQLKNSASSDSPEHRFFDIHPPVFWPAAILALLFIIITLVVGDPMGEVFSFIQNTISDSFGWFFVLVVNLYLFAMLYFAFSRYGNIRLGGKDAVPDFGRLSWFAMLFSAGMGIGILFWSVAEPIYHFSQPPHAVGSDTAAAQVALKTTFLHWGLHPWAVYALVGMALAFFSFNRDQPLAIRSIFYPLLGEKVNGPLGDIIDVVAVLATLFGLATSLGLGVQQVNAGLHHLFGLAISVRMQVFLIAAITLGATASVVSGLDHGVRRLSELNFNLGAVLLAFALLAGPTVFLLDALVQNLGAYADDFFAISFWTESYQGSNWQNSWTVFYWSWWIAWSPFVGMFIARISRGRTVREFVLSVLIIPTLLTFVWITAFGGGALFLELQELADMAAPIKENVAVSIYMLLEHYPLAIVANVLAIILVVSFFITSSDSGSLVVDAFTSGGKLDSPVGQRVFWASMEGAVAAVLLVGGGLSALQTATITMGLPFAVLLIIMVFSLKKGLAKEYEIEELQGKKMERESYQDLIRELMPPNPQNAGQRPAEATQNDEPD
ncbi:MAG: BCCT family transporter [Desulfosudaceae bacterium]